MDRRGHRVFDRGRGVPPLCDATDGYAGSTALVWLLRLRCLHRPGESPAFPEAQLSLPVAVETVRIGDYACDLTARPYPLTDTTVWAFNDAPEGSGKDSACQENQGGE